MLKPLSLEPVYREYVWGGTRLRPNVGKTAEAWVVYEGNQVSAGPYAGTTLAALTEQYPEELLGRSVVMSSGNRFPLLIKLLDCAAWLSLQVHPNDAQAEALVGPGHLGKTEAWYVVEADQEGQLLGGFCPGVSKADIEKALQDGGILDLVQRHNVKTGDSIYIPAGLIHALGPGLLVYEVQQTSDITYRVYDWDRPMTAGRKLHLAEARQVLDPSLTGQLNTAYQGGSRSPIVQSTFFNLEMIRGGAGPVALDTRGESFSALTILHGQAVIQGDGWQLEPAAFESVLIPAICGPFQVDFPASSTKSRPMQALHAFVPLNKEK